MKINVDRLTAKPAPFDFEATASWWQERVVQERHVDFAVDEPFRFDLELYMVGEDILVKGQLQGSLAAECSRCLQRYRHALAESFRLVLESAAGREPADPECVLALNRDGVSLGDDLEAGLYRGSEISLDAFFTEVISLALPLQPLCREDCRGLCARCGQELNRTECGCEELKPPSPFAVLEALRTADGERKRK